MKPAKHPARLAAAGKRAAWIAPVVGEKVMGAKAKARDDEFEQF